jgi:hypothetical protein
VVSALLEGNDFHPETLAIDIERHHQLGKLWRMHLKLDKNFLGFLAQRKGIHLQGFSHHSQSRFETLCLQQSRVGRQAPWPRLRTAAEEHPEDC